MKTTLLRLALAGLAGLALASGAAAQEKTGVVKIGLNESLSGPLQPVGVPPAAAVRLAAKEINDAGGFVIGGTRYRLEVIQSDNAGDSAKALAQITKMVEDDGIKFIFGPTQSAMAIQTAEVTAPANVIHISAASLWQSRGLLNDAKKPLLFGTQNPVPMLNDVDIAALKELGVKKIAIVSQDDETTKSHTNSFVPAARAAGIEVELILFPTDTADLTSYVSRAKAANVGLVWFFFPQARVNEVLRATIDLNAAQNFGGRAINPEAATKTATGKPVSIPFYSSFASPSFEFPPTPKVQAFRDRLLKFDPNVAGGHGTFSFFTYDFVPMLVEAMKKAGSVDDTAKIGKALAELTFEGVIGKICFGKEMRTASSDGGIIFVKDGKVDSRSYPSVCK